MEPGSAGLFVASALAPALYSAVRRSHSVWGISRRFDILDVLMTVSRDADGAQKEQLSMRPCKRALIRDVTKYVVR